MSPNPYPLFLVSQSDKPEQLKVKIKLLTLLYIREPVSYTAEAVAKHIAAILTYPNYIEDFEQRCQLRKLQMHWYCLAWNRDLIKEPLTKSNYF